MPHSITRSLDHSITFSLSTTRSLDHLTTLFLLLLLLFPSGAQAKSPDEELLFLKFKDVNVGASSAEAEQKQFLTTINFEKRRVTRAMLESIYENAYELYRGGDYDGANQLAATMLSIDSSFEDAGILKKATSQLSGLAERPTLSQRKYVEDRFAEGMSLYRQDRLVEAARSWDEMAKLAPYNLKAKYWLKRVEKELARYHVGRGEAAYEKGQLQEALDQWYSALTRDNKYPGLQRRIARAEDELQQQKSTRQMRIALADYKKGDWQKAMEGLRAAWEIDPANLRAKTYLGRIQDRQARKHLNEGNRFYNQRQYKSAIASWQEAEKMGYDPKAAAGLISRANRKIKQAAAKKEAEAKKEKEKQQDLEKEKQEKKAEAEKPAKAEKAGAVKEAPVIQASEMAGPKKEEAKVPQAPTEEQKRMAQEYYLKGLKFYHSQNFEAARSEWLKARSLDPANPDVEAGLRRVRQSMLGQ